MSSRSGWQVWSQPLMLGAIIVVGLLSALLGGDGIWWIIGWIALATPLAAIAWFGWRASKL